MTDNYYDSNAKEFFEKTVNVDMSPNYTEFLKEIPKKGHILDAGCGSGRDTLMFKKQGYKVISIDGSIEMCKLASKHTNQEILHMQFQEINFKPVFDGIWASASLLHIPSTEISNVLKRLKKSLKKEGTIYASFKYGDFEGKRNGRYFNDLTEDTITELFNKAKFKINKTWITNDARKERQKEKWINILATKP
jgi:SAM-dependent methyltransferase